MMPGSGTWIHLPGHSGVDDHLETIKYTDLPRCICCEDALTNHWSLEVLFSSLLFHTRHSPQCFSVIMICKHNECSRYKQSQDVRRYLRLFRYRQVLTSAVTTAFIRWCTLVSDEQCALLAKQMMRLMGDYTSLLTLWLELLRRAALGHNFVPVGIKLRLFKSRRRFRRSASRHRPPMIPYSAQRTAAWIGLHRGQGIT